MIFAIFPLLLFMIFGLLAAAVPVLIAVLVYNDAKKRGLDPLMWALLAVFVPMYIGLILYLIERSKYTGFRCGTCGEPIAAGAGYCGRCGSAAGGFPLCAGCGAPLNPDLTVCTRCGRPIS